MTTVIGGVPINPGSRLVVEDADYMFGLGRVTVVVREVLGVAEHDREPWVELNTDQVLIGGALVPRTITVRLAAVRAAVARARGMRS
jgi:hypothetical protein